MKHISGAFGAVDIEVDVTVDIKVDVTVDTTPQHGNAKAVCGGEYRDIPIKKPAGISKSDIPAEIAALYKEFRSAYTDYRSYQQIFYEQACAMKDYEDNHPFTGSFNCYYPTYTSLDPEKLRGYFTWRTNIRRGKFTKACLPYQFIYIYELLHLVGVSSPIEGFEALKAFFDSFAEIDKTVLGYKNIWLSDFIVYYGLDNSLLDCCGFFDNFKHLHALSDPLHSKNEDIFAAIKALSSYKIDRSALYKARPDDFKEIVCKAYTALCEYCSKHKKRSFFESTFGRSCTQSYFIFRSAVFYDTRRYDDYTYDTGCGITFSCRLGRWTRTGLSEAQFDSRNLAAFVKTVDSLIRSKTGFSPDIHKEIFTGYVISVIESVIDSCCSQKAAAPEITIDLSKLDDIRHSADITCERLLAEEEYEEPPTEASAPIPPCFDNESEKSPLPDLTENERRLLQSLLYKGELPHAAPLSLLADSINEKLYDIFGDTVIAFDGGTPELIEDYSEQLKEMIEP